METFKISMRDELVTSLSRLVDNTEEIFLRLANQCPVLLSEMNTGLQRSNTLARSVQNRDDRGSGSTSGIETEIHRTHQLIAEGSTAFATMHENDDRQLGELDASIQRLDDLGKQIFEIKEDSIEMELVSLNAMTVALKAGHAGLAFSYITEELKRLSTRTIALTEDITRRGERLRVAFDEFRQSLAETRRYQNALFSDFREKLTAGFEELSNAIDEVADTMISIRDRSTAVGEPIHAIMQEIQIQDIIKQSVGHVIISLKELNELPENCTREEVLDELAFFKQLPDLCNVVLDDVGENIDKSLVLFRDRSNQAQEIVGDVERRRSEFLQSLSGSDGSQSIQTVFQRSSSLLQSLMADLDTSMKKKQRIAEQSVVLMRDVRALEDDFREFAALITRFHSIDIASRIEVAKQLVLQRMGGTVEQMTILTKKIDTDVTNALEITKQFIESVSKAIFTFQVASAEEEQVVTEFSSSMTEQYKKLFTANTELSDSLSGFSLFTKQFMTLFSKTNQDLERLGRLVTDINVIKAKLNEIKLEADERMRPILIEMELDDWDIGSTRLQQMIERFTIFTHKKHAAVLGGFDVEDGTETGEITFF